MVYILIIYIYIYIKATTFSKTNKGDRMFVVVPPRSDAVQDVSDVTGSGAIRC